MYLEIRFSVNSDNKLVPRDSLTFGTLADYKSVMGVDISATEVNLLLSSDAIFNTKSGG